MSAPAGTSRVTVVPAQTPAAEVMALRPDGVFLSNGPGDPEPCDYAIAAIRGGQFDTAVTLLGNFQRRWPTSGYADSTRFWLGNALYHRGDLDGAESTFAELLERYPNFTIRNFHLGVIHQRKGEVEKAQEQFRAVLLKNPNDAAAKHYLQDV